MHRICLMVLALLLSATAASAQSWKVEEEEAVSLQYRDAKDEASLLEVHCTGRESQVVVPVAPGITDRSPLKLKFVLGKGIQILTLPASVCERDECVDRPAGQVTAYIVRQDGKDLALRLARAQHLSITSRTVTLQAAATADVFQRFGDLCVKQRRLPAG